ncbi:metallophosphoesterase [Denitrovibrio acetiphilus DSM 12809]|uniref:Metallophosphoesterase n=1 Tax=Denitrovibrio acetiphilus (strain DSM 12809 / NBRC 114555 / N2460) TaxID=522772 RepID=D4H7F9_DENA2|nr:metallophosphoesterase family protein [Denitrovibrio acetiphilus]ADD67958.1 metallophosphoesterase [Denitrovibrio acetiphilus DSM 12809]
MPVTAVIGDIHGCIRTLDRLINELEKRFSGVQYISLGDIVDRGPGIREVLQLFMNMKELGILTMVRGNHEDVFLDFAEQTNDYSHENWFTYGGRATLESISEQSIPENVTALSADDFIPYMEPYLEFIKSAEYKTSMKFENNNFMFSHAGIGPSFGQANSVYEFQARQNYLFMWSRDTWRSTEKYYGYTMVHGHTPVKEIEAHNDPYRPFVNRNKRGDLVSVAIDTGCVYGYSLSSMVIDTSGDFDFVSVRNCE